MLLLSLKKLAGKLSILWFLNIYLDIPISPWPSKFCLQRALNKCCWNEIISIYRNSLSRPERIKPDTGLVLLGEFIWSIESKVENFPEEQVRPSDVIRQLKDKSLLGYRGRCSVLLQRWQEVGWAVGSCPKQDRAGAAVWQLVYDKEWHLWRHGPGVMPHMLRLLRDAANTNGIGLKYRARQAWPSNEGIKASLGHQGRA